MNYKLQFIFNTDISGMLTIHQSIKYIIFSLIVFIYTIPRMVIRIQKVSKIVCIKLWTMSLLI